MPKRVIYVKKFGKISINFPNPFTPAMIKEASITAQVSATKRTCSLSIPLFSTYTFWAPIASMSPKLIKKPLIRAVMIYPLKQREDYSTRNSNL